MDEKNADIKFLLERALKAGQAGDLYNRDTGASANSLVAIAYGVINGSEQVFPRLRAT